MSSFSRRALCANLGSFLGGDPSEYGRPNGARGRG